MNAPDAGGAEPQKSPSDLEQKVRLGPGARCAAPSLAAKKVNGADVDLRATSNKGAITKTKCAPVAASTANPLDREAGNVVLRGVTIALDTDLGEEFVTDCSRNIEGLLSDAEIKSRWGLSDAAWDSLAANAPLLAAVRRLRDRRILNGDAAKEAARRHFAQAPAILNRILEDEQVSPRHRVEAARELRQVATSGEPANAQRDTVKIIINIGEEKLVFEKEPLRDPERSDDGEVL
jgi:hypothetical protein